MATEDKYADEVVSDDELDKVAGGYMGETKEDSEFLASYGLMDRKYDGIETLFGWHSVSRYVDEGWARAGITCCTVPDDHNRYWKDGQEITHTEAIRYVREKFSNNKSNLGK